MSEISTRSLFTVFGRIGVMSFGGPAAQIGLMHKELVEDRSLLTEQEFLRALSLCMLLPGPEAMQLATYAGWRLRGVFGGLVAGLLFVVPGATVILALALIYAKFGNVPLVQGAFQGVKAAVIIIVLQALVKVSGKALKSSTAWMLAGGAFVALFLFDVPYPLVIAAAGMWGGIALVRQMPSSKALPYQSVLPRCRSLRFGGRFGRHRLWCLCCWITHSFWTSACSFQNSLLSLSAGLMPSSPI